MASTCISNCITDARVPIRPTYVNLYKWPESDAEFVRSLSSDGRTGGGGRVRSTVVDSISCRVKKERRKRNKSKKKRMALRRAKEVSFAALLAMFRRLLSCTTKVDVADHGG
ncbi:hypothetical protein ES319_A08G002400v1 [Gossypium barbadense]|uniref:Uncharacterized protein n=2 Tax=Gossypium TaxID=3633 RepID=A0A5J5UJ64_GOSBA|nr:hypothetical protein ES319_A08G002400v1 [Gossypium barbadense]TYH04400.1 hypothetical protein ES288_A08G003300v1 [Gossypium darwinii]